MYIVKIDEGVIFNLWKHPKEYIAEQSKIQEYICLEHYRRCIEFSYW